jgi:cytochrome subunit of sulfide dehydrogenase
MKRWLLAAGMALACASGFAQSDKEGLYVKSLAATCANCHGTAGRTAEGSAVPGLAGTSKAYFTAQMAAFKSGARSATVMHQIAKGFTDAQIDALANYFAAQPK